MRTQAPQAQSCARGVQGPNLQTFESIDGRGVFHNIYLLITAPLNYLLEYSFRTKQLHPYSQSLSVTFVNCVSENTICGGSHFWQRETNLASPDGFGFFCGAKEE